MNLIDQIINQAKNVLSCPVCNSKYLDGDIKLKGFFDNIYIFEAFCANNHEPTVVTYMANMQRLNQPIGTYFHKISGEQISKNEVIDAAIEIDKFDGNFETLFQST